MRVIADDFQRAGIPQSYSKISQSSVAKARVEHSYNGLSVVLDATTKD